MELLSGQYLIWIVLYGFLLYYIFGVRKSDVPNYNECVQAAKFIVSDCVKIIEHVCYIFKDNSCILNVKLSCACPSANGQRGADQNPTL